MFDDFDDDDDDSDGVNDDDFDGHDDDDDDDGNSLTVLNQSIWWYWTINQAGPYTLCWYDFVLQISCQCSILLPQTRFNWLYHLLYKVL